MGSPDVPAWLGKLFMRFAFSAAAQNRKDAAHIASSSASRQLPLARSRSGSAGSRDSTATSTAETVHGVLRQLLLMPLVGDLHARQIGVVIGSAIILAIAVWLGRWIGARTPRAQLAVGGVWVVLTVAFELGLGTLLGLTRERMLADYDPTAGGFMAFGLLFMWLAPLVAAGARGWGSGG